MAQEFESLESSVNSIDDDTFDEETAAGSSIGAAPVPVVAQTQAETPAVPEEEILAPGSDPLSMAATESALAEEAAPAPETAGISTAAAPASATAEESAPAPETTGTEYASAAPAPGIDMAQAHSAVENAKQQFLNSKRKFGLITRSDDAPTVSLKNAIRDLSDLLSADVPEAEGDYGFALESICQAYQRLIKNCNDFAAYINSRRKPSSTERTRYDLSKQILAQSEKELGIFNLVRGQFIAGSRSTGESWTDILYSVRSEELNRNAVEKKGGGTSILYVRTNEDGSQDYIKTEEKLISDRHAVSELMDLFAGQSDEAAKLAEEYHNIPEKFKQAMDDIIMELASCVDLSELQSGGRSSRERIAHSIRASINVTWLTKRSDSLLVDLGIFISKKKTEFGVSDEAGITPGSTISDRNASSTRVAEALGMGNVVARSETVMITNEDGSTTRANSMEGAPGVQVGALMNKAREIGAEVTMTPEAAKALFELQVFDMITGQVDRHGGNYVAEYSVEILDEVNDVQAPSDQMQELAPQLAGKKVRYILHNVKGIDNDMAFGTRDFDQISRANPKIRPLIGRGLPAIPFLPRDYYERLMDPDLGGVLRFGQLDLRTDEEISAMLGRLEQVRQTLRILVNSGKLMIVDGEDEWERVVNERLELLKNRDIYARSYVSDSIL